MGSCLSSRVEVTEEEKMLHRGAEKSLREVRAISQNPTLVYALTSAVFTGQSQDGQSGQGTLPISFFHVKSSTTHPLATTQVLLLGSGDSGKSTILKVSLPPRTIRFFLPIF